MKELDRIERHQLLDKLISIIDDLRLDSDYPSHLIADHLVVQLENLIDLENKAIKWEERQNKPSDRSYYD